MIIYCVRYYDVTGIRLGYYLLGYDIMTELQVELTVTRIMVTIVIISA